MPGRVYIAFTPGATIPDRGLRHARRPGRGSCSRTPTPGGSVPDLRGAVSPFGSGRAIATRRSPSCPTGASGRIPQRHRHGLAGRSAGVRRRSPAGTTAAPPSASPVGPAPSSVTRQRPASSAASRGDHAEHRRRGGRVTVAWHASAAALYAPLPRCRPTTARAWARPADRSGGRGNQVAPRLAATAGGRVDAAYLWIRPAPASCGRRPHRLGRRSQGRRRRRGPSPSSCRRPAPAVAMPSRARRASAAGSASRRLLVPSSPLPATVVAFTDTQNPAGDQNVRVAGVLHGVTRPRSLPRP